MVRAKGQEQKGHGRKGQRHLGERGTGMHERARAKEQGRKGERQRRKATGGAYSFEGLLLLDCSNRGNELSDHAAHGGVQRHSDYHGQHLILRILGVPHLHMRKGQP